MNQLFVWGIALIVIAALMGVLHFAGVLIGDLLSWLAAVVFVFGVALTVAGAGKPRARRTQA